MQNAVKLLGAVALLIAGQGISEIANAADMAPRMYTKAAPVVPVFSWTGFYIGGHVGGAWSNTTTSAADAAALTAVFGGVPEPRGVFGGGQIGYNHQFQNNFVLGIELTGGAGPGFEDTVRTATTSLRVEGEYYVGLGGKLGYAFDRWLPYVVGGGAIAGNKATNFLPAFGNSEFKNEHQGYYVGGGLEYAFSRNWSAGLEYRYLDFDRRVYGGVTTGSEISTVTGRVNYRF